MLTSVTSCQQASADVTRYDEMILYATSYYWTLPVVILCRYQFRKDQIFHVVSRFLGYTLIYFLCPKSVQCLGTLWIQFGQVLKVWTSFRCFSQMPKMCPNKFLCLMCPNWCPKFGHIIDTIWTNVSTLDRFFVPFYKCPNNWLKFGCFLDIISRVRHILGTIWTHFGVWSHFWTHYEHIWEFNVQNVSVPTSCSSARKLSWNIVSIFK